MPRVLRIGGRMFEAPEQRSGRQDGWIIVQLNHAKLLGRALSGFAGTTQEEAALDIIADAHEAGRFFHIVAGLFAEVGQPWTVDRATKNAEFFADLTDPADKLTVMQAFGDGLQSFFLNGGLFSTPSPTSSTTAPAPDAPPTSSTPDQSSTATNADAGPMRSDGSPTATATS